MAAREYGSRYAGEARAKVLCLDRMRRGVEEAAEAASR
jgi:hypothetical protein